MARIWALEDGGVRWWEHEFAADEFTVGLKERRGHIDHEMRRKAHKTTRPQQPKRRVRAARPKR
jgi:hypothetical protein